MNEFTEHIQTSKPEIEQVEQEKQEFKLIDRILRTRGLKLFAYHPNGEIKEVEIKVKETLELDCNSRGELISNDVQYGDSVIDSRNIHFEALNLKTAKNRVKKWKQGKIQELDNLKKYNPNGLKW